MGKKYKWVNNYMNVHYLYNLHFLEPNRVAHKRLKTIKLRLNYKSEPFVNLSVYLIRVLSKILVCLRINNFHGHVCQYVYAICMRVNVYVQRLNNCKKHVSTYLCLYICIRMYVFQNPWPCSSYEFASVFCSKPIICHGKGLSVPFPLLLKVCK